MVFQFSMCSLFLTKLKNVNIENKIKQLENARFNKKNIYKLKQQSQIIQLASGKQLLNLSQNINQINSLIEINNLKMHTDPNEFKNRKQTKIDDDQAEILQNRVKQFEKQIEIMQQQFSHSQDVIYYIVSVKFINEWRDFCSSSQTLRLIPHSMNSDLYQKQQLRKGLVEKADFQLVNQQIYQLFDPYQDKSGLNKRQAVIIGHQKRVPIYLPSFQYRLITPEILHQIDLNRRSSQNFLLSKIEASEQTTLQNLLKKIQAKQKIPDQYEFRLWIPQKQITISKLYSLIKQQCRPCKVRQYKVQGVGKRVEDLEAKISQLMLDESGYFIVEIKGPSDSFSFVRDGQGRCSQCNRFGDLKYPCGCNKVSYCSQKCLQKDKVYHSRHCSYAQQMQLNKKVIMIRSEHNRHGLVGLNNLGNTCFMNSCLQCLSNTIPLTQYFLGQFFQEQINKVNPIGTKGKLAKNYAKFIKALWCDQDDTFSPYSVKSAVSSINPMFQGYAQHDSQQFFSFLVDGLHQDLNRILQKPIVHSPEQQNMSQSQFAKLSWISHLKRNQSIITDIMTGQYRSIVVCPDCKHKSTTFDPFITVSLPIPQNNQTIAEFFLIHANMQKKNKRAWFKYSNQNPLEWNKKACEAVGADFSKCCLYVVSLRQNIYKLGRQSMAQIIHKVQSQNKNMFLMEFSQEQLAIPEQYLVQFTLKISKIAYGKTQEQFFKIPILFDRRSVTSLLIYKKVLKFLYNEAYDNSKNRKTFGWGCKSYQQYEKQLLEQRPFKIILRTGKKIQRSYQRVQLQFKSQQVLKDDQNIIQYLQKQGLKITDCQIDARFQKVKATDFSFGKLKDFDTVGRQPKINKSQTQVQLKQCLESFKKPQILQTGNQWYCPKCKQHKLAKKQLGIYRAPKVLILHLKRFKQKGSYRKQKNQSLVKFPSELDMSSYLINPNPIQAYKQEIKQSVYQQPKAQGLNLIKFNTKSKPIYDLYAISNHYGGLGGGHYTAHAKNQGQWYNFDDSHVSKAGEKDIVSSSAYLLFYERRQ